MPKLGAEPVRRAETINATLECICEYGIDHTTLDMVAAKAGFSKGIVFYYFKSKKQLIEESLKAFFSSYQLKIGSSISADMEPLQMLNTVVEVSLPKLKAEDHSKINTSALEGSDKINLPEEKIAKLFVHFISKAANDEGIRNMIKEIYLKDVEGISLLMRNVMNIYPTKEQNDKKAAYLLLATIFGLSFFRILNFMPEDQEDNREIAFELIDILFDCKEKGEKV